MNAAQKAHGALIAMLNDIETNKALPKHMLGWMRRDIAVLANAARAASKPKAWADTGHPQVISGESCGHAMCPICETDEALDLLDDWERLVEEGAALQKELHQRQGDVLELRSLIARLPLTEYAPSPTLQAWYDEMKAVMARTNPRWLDTR